MCDAGGAGVELNDISRLLENERKEYLRKKIEEYKEAGFSDAEAINKANQSWRTHIGARIQDVILRLLETELGNTNLKLTTDRVLSKKNLSLELEMVKRQLAISYGEYLFLPDADIVVYKNCQGNVIKIVAIISVKNSFRERGFETTYWKLKLMESPVTSNIKVFLATPDKDNEISYLSPNGRPRKMRVILEYELDGLYFLKEDFEETDKAKHFNEIVKDIMTISKRIEC